VRSRELVWDGCVNVRDLGGHPTEDGGETLYGAVIRADSVGLLTADGWRALVDSGVSRIVDLRLEAESDDDAPRDLAVEVVHVPILDRFDEASWPEIEALSDGAPTHADAQRLVYLRFLEHCRSRFVEAVAAVAEAPPGAVVVHCHGGKDRTGLVVALLLRLAGVSTDAIADDYALSGERLRERHERWLAGAQDDLERARIERISSTPAAAMHGVLDAIDRRYGGVDQYLLGGGLSAELAEAGRRRLRP
jgi:protein tyrosine/serine phosphatase